MFVVKIFVITAKLVDLLATGWTNNHDFREDNMKSLFNTAAIIVIAATGATVVSAQDLTIAIVNNGHMINMQKVAEAYTCLLYTSDAADE